MREDSVPEEDRGGDTSDGSALSCVKKCDDEEKVTEEDERLNLVIFLHRNSTRWNSMFVVTYCHKFHL